MDVLPGTSRSLGSVFDGAGTNFALFSEFGDRVELCLLDDDGVETRVDLPGRERFVWHGYLPGVGPGRRYGYRVHGPFDPDRGFFHDPTVLLLDPYARAVDDGNRCGIVDNGFFDWGDDRHPRTPYGDSVLYEAHVKGLTARHPGIPADVRGTFSGLGHPRIVDHLADLGVTAVVLLPVQQFVHDPGLLDRGLRDYWGHHTLAWFAPHAGYGSVPGRQVAEFRSMVRALHAAGIEVLLDVDFTRTAEDGPDGPVLSLQGIDSAVYHVSPARARADLAGGTVLNFAHPQVLQLLMDVLRYWVADMHVDGFRLAASSTLARRLDEQNRLDTFLTLLLQDPLLSGVKLLGLPWEIDGAAYGAATLPPTWAEWDPGYRDVVRDLWRGHPVAADAVARLTGSRERRTGSGAVPYTAVTHVTWHEGFTLTDLVSYAGRHNEANGEGNVDGDRDERSWNCGVEGSTDDPAVVALRGRQRRNLLATLLLSPGVPALSYGDELGRTQRGNNNAWCQDNEMTWVDWEAADTDLIDFVRRAVALRRAHPVLRRLWVDPAGAGDTGPSVPDVAVLDDAGEVLAPDAWGAGVCAVYLNGRPWRDGVWSGGEIDDDDVLVLVNPTAHERDVALPPAQYATVWRVVLDTTDAADEERRIPRPAVLRLRAHSLLVLVSADRQP